MRRDQQKISAGGAAVTICVVLNIIILKQGWVIHTNWYWLLPGTLPLLIASVVLFRRRKG